MKRVKLSLGRTAKSKRYNNTEVSEIFEIPDDAVIVGAELEGYGSMSSHLLYVQPVNKGSILKKVANE